MRNISDGQYEYGINKTTSILIGICTKIIIVVLAVILIYLGVSYGFRFGRSLFYVDPAESSPGHDVEINITEYDTYQTLAQKLYESGAITDERSFVVQGNLYETQLVPGTYIVNTSQTIREMLLSIEDSAEEYAAQAESVSANEAAAINSNEVLTGGGEGD